VLGGSEAKHQSPKNSYELIWADVSEVESLNFLPEAARRVWPGDSEQNSMKRDEQNSAGGCVGWIVMGNLNFTDPVGVRVLPLWHAKLVNLSCENIESKGIHIH